MIGRLTVLFGKSALIVVALVIVSSCSGASDLEGKSFTNTDGSERIVFRDDKQVEVTSDGLALQGEYSIEEDSSIRLVVDFMGAKIVGYGSMNDDGGFTMSLDDSTPTRYFSTEDPKLALANRDGEIVLRTVARFCEEGTCPELMLSRERDIVVSTASLSIGDRHKVAFSEIEDVKFADISGRYGSVVRVKGGGHVGFGGWQGLHFSQKADRDTFYQELVAAVSNWHSTYGVKGFSAAEIPGVAPRESLASRQANQPTSTAANRSIQSDDPLVGVWEIEKDGHRLEVGFAPDKTLSWKVDDKQVFGTYARVGEQNLELIIFEKSDDERPDTAKFSYRLQDRSLILMEISSRTNEPRPGAEALELVKLETAIATSLKWPPKSVEQQSLEYQLREGLNLSGGAKAAVSEFIVDTGVLPKNNLEAGVSEASGITGKYVTSVEVKNGRVIVTYGEMADPSIAGYSIYLVPNNSNPNSISWQCYSDSAISRYAPRACANTWTGSQASQTAVSTSTASVEKGVSSESARSRQRSRAPESGTSDSSGPILLFSVPPEYPARAKSRGMEGTVQVQFSIDANGKTKDVIVLQSSSSTFERAAIASILERRYEPPGTAITGLKDSVIFKLD